MKRIINKISKCAKKVSPTFHFPLFTLNFPTFHFPLSTFLLLTFYFLLSTFHFPLTAQSINYPVQANTIIKPPYSLYLSDYSAPGNDLLTLQLLLKDLNEPEMQVRLRLEILGNNITIRTRDNYVPPPIILGGGIPEVLYSSDLASYFDVRNLDFQGYSEQEYIKSGKLPEGVYQISFTVYDYMYNRQISNKGLSIAWMMLNDPPIINTPRNYEKIRASDPQNIAFSWTPRHMGSPNSAFATEYEFTIVELWPENRNPNDAILSSMPIFQMTTMATSLYYGPAETALEPGRKYAFRVRAYDVEGRDLFKNQGYSEVYTFTYGDACLPPEGITGASPAEDRISIEWQQQMNHSGYKVQVRKANNDNAEWFTKSANINKAIVEGLEAGTLYEYRLISTCGTISGEPSEVYEVSTKEANPGNFACNVPSGDFDLENMQPLPGLFKGDVIDAGDFDVKVMESFGSNGRFTGSGSLVMPFMNNIRVQVDFNNIAVNTDYKMTDGSMKVVRGSVQLLDDAVYDAIDNAIATIDQIDTALAVSEEVAGVIHDYTTLDTLHTDGNVSSVYINDDGMIVVVDKEGNSTLHEPPPGGLLVEGAGVANGYVAKGGKVTHEAVYRQDKFAKNNLNADSLELPLVQFMAHPDQTYGFDTPDRRVPENYQVLVAGDKPHYIPWKAIKEGEEDKILVRVTGDKGFDPGKIEFRSASRTYTTTNARSEGKDRIYEITLTGGDPDTPEELYAIYPTDSAGLLLGKLNIRCYSEENKTVTLVRLKGSEGVLTDIEKIKTGLNDIFRQSVATWTVQEITVEVETTDWDINGDGLLEYGNSDFISTYTGEMKEFIHAFEDKHKVSMDDGYFVFLFPGEPDTNRKPDAFMPKKRQYAFMFTRYMTSNPIRTLAHELSHGAYRLSHPWELHQALQKGTTGNLMDYVDSTRLYQYQWNHIHNPPAMIGWMQDDVDGEYKSDFALLGLTVYKIEDLEWLDLVDNPLSFISPTGQLITLPSDAYDFRFDPKYGSLIGFTLNNGVRYLTHKYSDSGLFAGYRSSESKEEEPYTDIYSDKLQYPVTAFIAIPDQKEKNCFVTLDIGLVGSFNPDWDLQGGIKEQYSSEINAIFESESQRRHTSQYSLYNCSQKPITKLVIKNLLHLIEASYDLQKLDRIRDILDNNQFAIAEEYKRIYNISGYTEKWEQYSDYHNFVKSDNLTIDDWLYDFESFSRDAYHFYNRIKEETNEERLLSYSCLLNEGQIMDMDLDIRKKLLNVFFERSTLPDIWEGVVLKILHYTPQEQIKPILDLLAAENYEKLFWLDSHIDEGFLITYDGKNLRYHLILKDLIKRHHHLPADLTPDNIYQYYAGDDLLSDKPIKAYFRLQDQQQQVPSSRHSIYTLDEAYYYELRGNLTILNAIECVEKWKPLNSHQYICEKTNHFIIDKELNPYDLVVILDLNETEYLDAGQKDKLINARVVPAFFFHYLSREKNQAIAWEITEDLTTLAAFVIPAGQIVTGLKIGGSLGNNLIKWSLREIAFNSGVLITISDEYEKWCYDNFGENAPVILYGSRLIFASGSLVTGLKGGQLASEAKDALSAAATIQKIDDHIKNGKIPDLKAEDYMKVRMSLLDYVDDIRKYLKLADDLDLLRIAYRYDDLFQAALEYPPAISSQLKTFVGKGGDILVSGKTITLQYNDEVVGVLEGTLKPSKVIAEGESFGDIVIDGFKLADDGKGGVAFIEDIADITKLKSIRGVTDDVAEAIAKRIDGLGLPAGKVDEITDFLAEQAKKTDFPVDKLAEDISKGSQEFIERIVKEEGLVESWKVIKSVDDPVQAAKAADVAELELVSKYLDDIEAAGGYSNWKAFDNLFSSSRQRAIEKFGKEAEDLIYVKYHDDGGAAAEILDHYGTDGLNALKKASTIDGAASELVKNKTVYRAVNETTYNFNKLKTQGIIDASPVEHPAYVSLDNYTDANTIQQKLQLPKKPTWVAEFDGNQIVNDVRVPNGKFLTAEYKEVLCRSYPEINGVKLEGGGSQFITNSEIKVSKLINLETGEVITFTH